MSSLAWAAAGAVAGLGVALVLFRKGLVPAWLMRGADGGGDGRSLLSHGGTANGGGAGDTVCVRLARHDLELIRDDIQGLHVIRTDLQRVGDLLGRLLEETMAFQRRLDPPRPGPAGGPARGGFREPVRDTPPEPSSLGGAAWRQEGRDPDPRVQHDQLNGGFDPNPRTREPSPDAVFVEANNDAVVHSVRHPPEAWLERRGGQDEVWLNPRVPLTDPALQRWSTFFDWERREPGARYQVNRPAVVTWSGSGGSVLRKGVARPL